jgi:hypothetical protein
MDAPDEATHSQKKLKRLEFLIHSFIQIISKAIELH